jgi:hypothetical protein
MGELEELLRSEIARRRDDFTPAGDLTERIHARVAKRRRQRQAFVGAVGAGLAAVVVAGVLLATPSSDQTVEVADDHDASTTTTVTAPTPGGGDDTAPRTEPTDTPETTDAPDDAPGDTTEPDAPSGGGEPGSPTGGASEGSSPSTTSGGGTTTTATGDPLLAPDGETPAAGTCGAFAGTVVEIVLHPDIPSPRCVEVTAEQILQVSNAAGETVDVSFGGTSVALAAGDAYTFDQPFGDYLAPGVHRVSASIYGDSGAEIWLKP